jgi:DNA topoisomerase-1
VNDEVKFYRMALFGKKLPEIRRHIDSDLRRHGMPREKVLAAIVYLLEKSLIRVGNAEYAKQNKSFGLTTLRNRHVSLNGSSIEFKFFGKSKVKHQIRLTDRRLASILKKLQDLPGQELFAYQDDEGGIHSLNSTDVNDYLKDISKQPFTAKDFRTWAGTTLTWTEFAGIEPGASESERKTQVATVVKAVASQLGNTPAVCRKCYIHPAVVEAFLSGTWTGKLEQSEAKVEREILTFLGKL